MDYLVEFFFKHKWATFAKGQLGFANRPSWLLMALIGLALGLLVYFLYIRPGYRINSKAKLGMIALRASLLALLLIMLMRPVVVVPSIIPKSTSVAVLTDDSRSMQLADENNRRRIDAVPLADDQHTLALQLHRALLSWTRGRVGRAAGRAIRPRPGTTRHRPRR